MWSLNRVLGVFGNWEKLLVLSCLIFFSHTMIFLSFRYIYLVPRYVLPTSPLFQKWSDTKDWVGNWKILSGDNFPFPLYIGFQPSSLQNIVLSTPNFGILWMHIKKNFLGKIWLFSSNLYFVVSYLSTIQNILPKDLTYLSSNTKF